MVWTDMKKFIASQMCEIIEQVSLAISEYLASHTPEKCRKFFFHLIEVQFFILFWPFGTT
jgi:hypothetical protein